MKKKVLISLILLLISKLALAQKQEPRLVLPVGHTNVINSAVFSPDGKLVLTSSDDGTARIFESKSGKEIYVKKDLSTMFSKALFCLNGDFILCNSDSAILLIDYQNNKIIKEFNISDNFDEFYLSHDRTKFIFNTQNTLEIWDLVLIKRIWYSSNFKSSFNSIEFSQDDELVLINDHDNVNVIKYQEDKILYSQKSNYYNTTASLSKKNNKKDDQFLVITNPNDSTVKVINLFNQNKVLAKKINRKIVSSFFSPDNQSIFVMSDSIISLNLKTHEQKCIYENKGFERILFRKNNSLLILLGSFEYKIFNYSSSFLTEVPLETNSWSQTSIIDFSPEQENFVTIEMEGFLIQKSYIRIYNIKSGKRTTEMTGSAVGLYSSVNSKNNLVLTNTNFAYPVLWDYITAKSKYIIDTTFFSNIFFRGDSIIGIEHEFQIDGVPSGGKTFVLNSVTGEVIDTASKILEMVFNYDLETNLLGDKYLKNTDDRIFIWQKSLKGSEDILLDSISLNSGRIQKVKFLSDDKLVVLTSNELIIYDKDFRKIYKSFKLDTTFVPQYISISPDEQFISVESPYKKLQNGSLSMGNSRIDIFNLQNNSKRTFLAGARIFGIIFTQDSKKVIWTDRIKTNIIDLYSESQGYELKGAFSELDNILGRILTCAPNKIYYYEISTGKLLKEIDVEIRYPFFSIIQGTDIMIIEGDNKTILWDLKNDKVLYTRIQLEGLDWLAYDEHYRFDGTPGAIEKLYFVCGLEVVELNQVKDSLYVPNLVQRIMNGENLDHLPKLSDLNICGVTPIVEPIDKGDKGYHYEITPRTGGVGDIEIYLNGVVRQTENAKRLKLKNGKYSIQVDPKLIERYQIPGEALQVKVIAKTANNSISSRGVVLDLESDEPTSIRKPSLHAVMIGVDDYKDDNLDLNYAAKDANDLHQALEQASKKFFNVDDTNRVFFYNLTRNREGKLGTDKIKGKTPDKANINQTLEEIEKKSKPEDILLVFFAGHGEIVDKDQLLLLTTEATSANFEGIRMRELLEQLNKIPAGKRVLILDACHSGAAINNMDMAQLTGKRDVKDAERQSQRLKELDKLASKSGFAIITASSSDQKALELPQYEHGLMTYALLNAMLNNKSSLDENNQLQLEKWLIATEEEVKKLNQNQSAERMVPVTFTLGKIDEEVRSSIVLKEIPTVFVDAVINKNTFKDNLNIKSSLSAAFQEMSRGTDTQIMVADFPNAVKVNILYEEKGDEVKASIILYKENFEQKFELTGKKANISAFVQDLMNQIRTKIQK